MIEWKKLIAEVESGSNAQAHLRRARIAFDPDGTYGDEQFEVCVVRAGQRSVLQLWLSGAGPEPGEGVLDRT